MADTALQAEPRTAPPETGFDGKTEIATGLNGVLADSYVLLIKTQGCHWNVVGPLFQPIRALTEAQSAELFAAIDALAERLRALGHLAPLSFADMICHAELSEEEAARSAAGMLEQLIGDHEALTRRLRVLAALASARGDGATEDLATARMAAHEKAVWMLRAIAAD